jgi:TolB-like protein/Flp pilus assembly protein TadD
VDFEGGLNSCMRQIRAALGDEASTPRYVQTLPKRGYRFLAPVGESRPAQQAAAARAAAGRRPGPAASVALAALAAAGFALFSAARRPPERLRVAVLPFESLGSPPGEEGSLGDGLTEELISALGRTRPQRVAVLGRASTRSLKGSTAPASRVARDLGVDYVVSGSVRREGIRVRVTATLLAGRDGSQQWTESYDRELSSVLDLQRLVALDITRSLTRELSPRPETPASGGDTAAVEAYLRGRHLLARGTDEELRRALELFGEARARDPGDARACAAEAEALYLMGAYGLLPPAEASRRGSDAALAALVRDPELAEAHAILGRIRHRFDKDLPGAQVALERALAINPSSAAAHQWNAHQLDEAGRPREALAAIRHAHELDPRSLGISADLASLLHAAGRRAEAEARFRETLELDPAFTKARYLRGLAYEREGRHGEALAEFRRARSADPRTPKFLAALGRAQSRLGDAAAALGSLTELRSLATTRYVSADLLDGLAELVERPRAAARSAR